MTFFGIKRHWRVNNFFAEQWWLTKKNGKLAKKLWFLTEKRLRNVQFSNDNIIKVLIPIKLMAMILSVITWSIFIFKSCLTQTVEWNFLWNRKKSQQKPKSQCFSDQKNPKKAAVTSLRDWVFKWKMDCYQVISQFSDPVTPA